VVALKDDLATIKAEAKAFREECAHLSALRDSSNEFLTMF
jgi:hypothetical protein